MNGIPVSDEEYKRNYHDLKKELEQAFHKIRKTEDLRTAKGILIEVQSSFKGRKLRHTEREELYNRLQEAFMEINAKLEEQRLSFEKEALLNYPEMKRLIDEALYLANHPHDFHETWDYLREIQSSFKSTKLLPEHRDELYRKLQLAFDTIKNKQIVKDQGDVEGSEEKFGHFLNLVTQVADKIKTSVDLHELKDELISLQREIRDSGLARKHRDELNPLVQEIFETINVRLDEEALDLQIESENLYKKLIPLAKELLDLVLKTDDLHEAHGNLRSFQDEVRGHRMLKIHREELNSIIHEAFDRLHERQKLNQEHFEAASSHNYSRLKSLIEEGFHQAEVSSKYKETREFLKKIQSEFKGIPLQREQREELYSRLQSAFAILNKRVDEYFRLKKKNWMLTMEYKLSETTDQIYTLEKSIEKDQENIKELEDQLEIVLMAGKEQEVISGLKSRISSLRRSLERKENEIKELQEKTDDLRNIVDPPEEQE